MWYMIPYYEIPYYVVIDIVLCGIQYLIILLVVVCNSCKIIKLILEKYKKTIDLCVK